MPEMQLRDDPTLGHEFTFTVMSWRWAVEGIWEQTRLDTYRLVRNAEGWFISFISINGQCGKDGSPVLFGNLRQDLISYPADLGNWLEYLWDKAQEQALSHEAVQDALDSLAQWVCEVEHKAPGKGVWSGYKRQPMV